MYRGAGCTLHKGAMLKGICVFIMTIFQQMAVECLKEGTLTKRLHKDEQVWL